jgi:hypothetical protein
LKADIYIYNRDIKISAKSIKGKVKSSYEKVISKDSGLKIYSLKGDIIDN